MIYIDKNRIYVNDEKWFYDVAKVGRRIILVPSAELKKAQRFFLRAIKWHYPLKMETLKSAKIHSGKKWVLKLDIKNFYPSVPYEDIKEVITVVAGSIKYANINYYLEMVTVNKKLPIGAPTSAHIANACFLKLDKAIKNYCKLFDVDYSRYMDDLTFSSDYKEELVCIEKRVTQILETAGYKVNPKKIKYICENKQQNVLGLVVNGGKTRLSKKFKKELRAMIHRNFFFQETNDIKYVVNTNVLEGYLAYCKHVDKKFYDKLIAYKEMLYDKYKSLY